MTAKEWPDVPALVEEARQASVRPALWEPYRLYNALADALETMHDLYLQESATVSLLTGQLDEALYKEGHVG